MLPVYDSVNYFQIFGLEKRYEIEDLEALEGKYKEWQKKLHPDFVHSKSHRERDYAAEQSARVIVVYRTLSKPLSRATYILQLEGVNINEEETVTEPQLLCEIMEIREAVEEAVDSPALIHIQSGANERPSVSPCLLDSDCVLIYGTPPSDGSQHQALV